MNVHKTFQYKGENVMEKRGAEKYGIDRHGNPLEIKFAGVDTGELAHFGGLDLQVNV